jgi:hypothetical protein
MAYGLTEALNKMNELGVFSYALPFLIVFAIVYGILTKLSLFGKDESKTKGVNLLIAIGVAGMSLLYDQVPTFFASIFPKFGIGLAVFLVLVIALGFFYMGDDGKPANSMKWIGWLIGIGVVLWGLNEWSPRGYFGGDFGFLIQEYLPMLIVVGLIIWGIIAVTGSGKEKKG